MKIVKQILSWIGKSILLVSCSGLMLIGFERVREIDVSAPVVAFATAMLLFIFLPVNHSNNKD